MSLRKEASPFGDETQRSDFRELERRARNGDAEAENDLFAVLISTSVRKWASYKFSKLPSLYPAAEDIFDSALLALIRRIRKSGYPDNIMSYLFIIVRNLSITCDFCEALGISLETIGREIESQQQSFVPEWVSIEAKLDIVLNTLAELPPRHRDPIELRYLQQCSRKEIMKMLKCSERTLKRRLSEGLERLRQLVAHKGINRIEIEIAIETAPQQQRPTSIRAVDVQRRT